jgi:hypothetical protein
MDEIPDAEYKVVEHQIAPLDLLSLPRKKPRRSRKAQLPA